MENAAVGEWEVLDQGFHIGDIALDTLVDD
jgi:hypothetical protein